MKKRTMPGANKLRKRAEARVVTRPPAKAGPHDTSRLLHELRVHQIELEMQNEELLAARHQLEKTLTLQTELFEHAPIGYLVLDSKGSIRHANLEASRMLSVTRKALVGRRVALFIAEADRAAFAVLLEEILATANDEGPRAVLDVTVYADGSEQRQVRLIGSRLSSGERQVMLAIHDVTARKRAERALQNEIRSRDEFLAALSHELRNPLASVRTSLALLAHVKPGAPEARKATDIASRQVDHLAHIVDDLLDATRVSTGKIRLQRSRTDLGELVRRAVEDHRSQFQQRGIALACDLAREPLWADADATRLIQAFANLLVNAMKFTPPGGHVQVSLRVDSTWAVVSVRDDGVGMAPELCNRIFAPFVQGPQPLDRSLGGLGLGLATVKGLIELHGGNVAARSAGPGSGSVFEVRLPIAHAPELEPDEPPIASAENRRVLVIDDAVESAEVLADLLMIAGHQARVAHDGPSGLALAHTFRPEFVFCDIGLPGMDGYEVARTMRADASFRAAYLVALSGYALAEDRRRSADAGFDDHLAKPASWEAIVRILARDPAARSCTARLG